MSFSTTVCENETMLGQVQNHTFFSRNVDNHVIGDIHKAQTNHEVRRSSSLEVNIAQSSRSTLRGVRERTTSQENIKCSSGEHHDTFRASRNDRTNSFSPNQNSSVYICIDECGNVPEESASSKVLDWLSTCFWKCSPGCQDIPIELTPRKKYR